MKSELSAFHAAKWPSSNVVDVGHSMRRWMGCIHALHARGVACHRIAARSCFISQITNHPKGADMILVELWYIPCRCSVLRERIRRNGLPLAHGALPAHIWSVPAVRWRSARACRWVTTIPKLWYISKGSCCPSKRHSVTRVCTLNHVCVL